MRERFGAREAGLIFRALDPAAASVAIPLPNYSNPNDETSRVGEAVALVYRREPWLVLVDPDAEEVRAARCVADRRGARLAQLKVHREVRKGTEFAWVKTHTYRKTVATVLDGSSSSARLIADQLGHSRISMTQDVYMGRRAVDTAVADALGAMNPTGKDEPEQDGPQPEVTETPGFALGWARSCSDGLHLGLRIDPTRAL